jgi:predicted  nucleic acid-binding Zn-ribbon protein
MVSQVPVTDRILGTIKHTHGCDLDTLAESVPELTWNQVFLEIDRLSRQGEILVTCTTGGRYKIQLPAHKKEPKTHHPRS